MDITTETDRRHFLATLGVVGMAAATQIAVGAEPARPKIRVGQIGVGHPHAAKLSVYRESPDYEVVGIVEPEAALRERAKTLPAYRDVPWMTQEELLQVPGLQVVLIETQVRDLLNVGEACVAAGKHIHLDKPAGDSYPQLERILASAKQQKLLVQMGYMYRYSPGVVLLREFLKNGWLGEVFEIHAVMSKTLDPASRVEHAEYRGGMMFELGCHVLDLVVGVLGKPEKVTSFKQHASPLKDELADNMLAVLQYPRAIASIKSSAQEVNGGDRRHFVVCGTEGTFQIQPLDNPSAQITLAKKCGTYGAGVHQVKFPTYTRYVADAADMAAILRREKPSDFSYEHDLIVQKALLEASQLPLDK